MPQDASYKIGEIGGKSSQGWLLAKLVEKRGILATKHLQKGEIGNLECDLGGYWKHEGGNWKIQTFWIGNSP
jgi:hypothetical protein